MQKEAWKKKVGYAMLGKDVGLKRLSWRLDQFCADYDLCWWLRDMILVDVWTF